MKTQSDQEKEIEPGGEGGNPDASQRTKRMVGWSPRFKARMAGAFEVLEGAGSAGGQVLILGGMVVQGNAAATATTILTHQPLFWLGFAASLMAVVFHIGWAFLLYDLLKPVSRRVSLAAMFVILVGCAIQALTSLLYLAPLLVLQGRDTLSALTPQQVQDLAYVFLRLNAAAFNVYLVFFGLWCVLIGFLIFRSTFLPRLLGILLMIDGVAWMLYLYPPLAQQAFPLIAVASGLAEIPLELWLLIVGVNAERWKEQDAASRSQG